MSCDLVYRRSAGTRPVKQMRGDVDMVLARIKEYVFVNRVRIGELFKDNDPLRSGVIAASRFRQVGCGVGMASHYMICSFRV